MGTTPTVSRRRFLRGNFRSVPPDIRPRDAWADAPPTGPLLAEPDVRFLLVHHTAGTNDYGPEDVPDILRWIFRFHTGPERGWPDVAYNFFVDRYGQAWEGRSGSKAGPVQADATGGSQGFAQLVSLIGDHSADPATPEALDTLVSVLAMLADRHGLDTAPGATATFVSRGSNRWAAGTSVTATTISGHRDMSLTACPGDAVYALVADGSLATAVAGRRPPPPTTTPATGATTTTATTIVTTTTTEPPTSASANSPTAPATTRAGAQGGDNDGRGYATAAAVLAGAGAAALIALRLRTRKTSVTDRS
ncbi:MAG: N-acetylmuramoyl-L-alanine amidase [Acidimicrobiales bacterium]